MTGMPLAGVRILDLTRLVPGAVCTLTLADMGADVVKVEQPGGGDPLRSMPPLVAGRSALFDALNRNKRSLALNLKPASGRDLLVELAKTADALVEGNRPGVMARLGLGWEVLHAANPRLVMCSITGYGQTGPLSARAGHDINYMALAGALSLTGPVAGGPMTLGLQVADVGPGGVGAACSILAALLEVARGAGGRHLDVSMTDGAAAWTALQMAEMAASGRRPERSRGRLTGLYPCYRIYACADGFLSVGALEPKFWSTLCQALGRQDLIPLQFAEGEEGARAHRQMEAVFAVGTRAQWEAKLAGRDVCVEPVLELDEVERHPHAVARGLVLRSPEGVEIAPPGRLQAGWRRLDPPELGEHTAEVLREVGVDAAGLERLRLSRAV
ncbi:MAG: CaiB/BaiF CoA transferase family protein [Candidatus Dormibacteraceae bacterium]